MKKKLFRKWLALFAILLSVNMQAQMTVGGKKAPEPFSVLELLNKGGLRLPQMTTAERNAFAVKNNDKGNGLTIYNKTTGCVEYWNANRWVSLCDGTSQTTISPAPCTTIAANGTGCDQVFSITDPDCPNGPFAITIIAGADYASLTDVDTRNGSFKVAFRENNSVDTHTILVRVTSTCTSMYKEFLFSQNGVSCTSLTYAAPAISPSSAALSVCTGGAVYLSVPATTANLDKLIWTRNGIEIARGVSFIIATQKGKYDISMGAVGCNIKSGNERVVTESGSAAASTTTIIASNNGVLCGTNSVTLTASGTGTIAWFQNGVEVKSGASTTISGDSSLGQWFAVVKNGTCYSNPSNVIDIIKGAAGQVTLADSNALVNGVALSSFTGFCAGGSLDLSIASPTQGVSYMWYNGAEPIYTNPFVIPSAQTSINLRVVATDNSGLLCSREVTVGEKTVSANTAPGQPNISGNVVLCDGTTDLTLVPAIAGTYTYTWYKNNVKMSETTATIKVNTPGVTYSGSVTNASGCTSTIVSRTIAENVSSLPVLSWVSKPTTATYGAKVTLQTAIEFGPATNYTWSADKEASITGSGASVTIQLPASGVDNTDLTIKVTAESACGKSSELQLVIKMNNVCPAPGVVEQVALSQTATVGAGVNLSVSVTSGVNPTYQWYTNAIPNNGSGTIINGATSSTYSYVPGSGGTFYLFCRVTNGCVGNLATNSAVFIVNVSSKPDDLPAGSGSLSGRACFDIAESNDNSSCGLLSTRATGKANFDLTAINTQTYTFTPSGSVSKVRFSFVESLTGAIVKSLTSNGDSTALNVSSAVTATVVYKNTLSTNGGVQGAAYGKSDANALIVDLYVVYNDKADGTGKDLVVKLKAQIKDCSCCGGYIKPGVWKNFMCHNLGVDQSLDPLVPSANLYGNYYSHGVNTPGTTEDTGEVNGYWRNSPCPTGYRLPTSAEISGLMLNNTIKSGWSSGGGTFVGSGLFFPFSGLYTGDEVGPATRLSNVSSRGFYWTSEPGSVFRGIFEIVGGNGGPTLGSVGIMDAAIKLSIRCISND
ncbi:hypothetical protein [uncultured Flavobacterium sp.]|uniref:hypothetical protein n=1 Tax=uncultured Flavobacterium sp. TaxID=165435 RepID=UPI003081D6C4